MFTGKRARDKATVAPREKLLKQRCSSTAFRDKPSADASGVHRFVPESQPIMSTPLVIIAFSLLACNSFFNQAPRILEAAKAHVQVKPAIHLAPYRPKLKPSSSSLGSNLTHREHPAPVGERRDRAGQGCKDADNPCLLLSRNCQGGRQDADVAREG